MNFSLQHQDSQSLHRLAQEHPAYLTEASHLLALALHEESGWPLYGWLDEVLLDEEEGEMTLLLHAFVSPDDGATAVDLLGARPTEATLEGKSGQSPWLQQLSPQEILNLGEGHDVVYACLTSSLSKAHDVARQVLAYLGQRPGHAF